MPESLGPEVDGSATVSIVIEWENALNAETSRTTRMLEILGKQLQALNPAFGPVEVLFVFDEREFPEDQLQDTVKHSLGSSGDAVDWRLLPAETAGYYSCKNQGGRAATGELLLFLDSDVIPEDGWLAQMLAPFIDPGLHLLAGSAYIEPEGRVGQAFALTWFFPLRSEDGPLMPVTGFFANNLAMRRSLFQRYPFPDLSGTSRGSCIVLAEQLRAGGISIYRNPNARVTHPAPNGWRHFRDRALVQGRDRLVRERLSGTAWSRSWGGSFGRLMWHWARCWRNILVDRHKVGLGWPGVPAVGAISCTYYLLYWFGETASLLGLEFVRRIRV
jgi:hypothetical protein